METGTYLMNYAGCQQCKEKTAINNIEIKSEHDDDGNETVTFKRKYQSSSQCTSTALVQVCHVTYLSVCIMSSSMFLCTYLCEVQRGVLLHSHVNNNVMIFLDVCQQCGHVIADHEYTFSVDDQYQVFTILVFTMQ